MTRTRRCNTKRGVNNVYDILRLNDRDDALVRKFAAIYNISVSELIRNSVIGK